MIMKPSHGEGRKAPLSSMTSGPTPRWDYASPTIKKQFGKPPELGTDIANYKLRDIDVQTEMRNFPGYTEANYFTLEDMQQGDNSGATDTDADTHTMAGRNTGGGYTRINQKSGPKDRWPNKRS